MLKFLLEFLFGATNPSPPPQKYYDEILGELKQAIVAAKIERFAPGRVKYRGSWWQAVCDRPDTVLLPGTRVQVVGRDITWLVVEPCRDERTTA